MVKVSIIVPVYNAEKYLEDCLNSLKNQSLKDIEILCINDGSSDDSLTILNQFAKEDTRFKIFSQKNAGPAKARNIGLENSTGEFIMFCDADDTYEPKMCQKMYHTITHKKTDVVMCNSNYFKKDLSVGKNKYLFPSDNGKQELTQKVITKTNVYLWNKIFKKSIIDKYHITFPNGHKSDDNLFIYEYLMSTKSIYFLDQKLYNHFERENSIMDLYHSDRVQLKDLFDKSDILALLYDYLKENNLWDRNKKTFLNRLYQEYRFSWLSVSEIWEKQFFKNLIKNIHHIGLENIKETNYLFWGICNSLEKGNFYAAARLSDAIISKHPQQRRKYTFQEHPQPIFKKDAVTLVFNCDNNYTKYFSATLQSIIEHSSDHYYDLVILNNDMTDENKDTILSMISGKQNFSIRFFDMTSYEKNYQIAQYKTVDPVKTEAYYKLFIPKIFENYQRVIYLDSDLITNTDLFELSTIDLKGRACAAVADFHLSHITADHDINFPGIYEYGKKTLHLKEWKSYFNSGVMIYNIPKMIEKSYVKKFIEMAQAQKNDLFFNVQNVLNSVLQEDVCLLPDVWNMQIYNEKDIEMVHLLPSDKIKILHFCSCTKPWTEPQEFLAYLWWNYAKKSPFYETIIKENLCEEKGSLSKSQTKLFILMHPIYFKIKKMIYKIKRAYGTKYHQEKYKKKYYDLKQLMKAAKEMGKSIKF